jgi:hypothetical protein
MVKAQVHEQPSPHDFCRTGGYSAPEHLALAQRAILSFGAIRPDARGMALGIYGGGREGSWSLAPRLFNSAHI